MFQVLLHLQTEDLLDLLEVLVRRDLSSFQADELAAIKRAITLLARRLSTRASRRYRAAAHGQRIDARRTLRRSLQYGGTVIRTRPQTAPHPQAAHCADL